MQNSLRNRMEGICSVGVQIQNYKISTTPSECGGSLETHWCRLFADAFETLKKEDFGAFLLVGEEGGGIAIHKTLLLRYSTLISNLYENEPFMVTISLDFVKNDSLELAVKLLYGLSVLCCNQEQVNDIKCVFQNLGIPFNEKSFDVIPLQGHVNVPCVDGNLDLEARNMHALAVVVPDEESLLSVINEESEKENENSMLSPPESITYEDNDSTPFNQHEPVDQLVMGCGDHDSRVNQMIEIIDIDDEDDCGTEKITNPGSRSNATSDPQIFTIEVTDQDEEMAVLPEDVEGTCASSNETGNNFESLEVVMQDDQDSRLSTIIEESENENSMLRLPENVASEDNDSTFFNDQDNELHDTHVNQMYDPPSRLDFLNGTHGRIEIIDIEDEVERPTLEITHPGSSTNVSTDPQIITTDQDEVARVIPEDMQETCESTNESNDQNCSVEQQVAGREIQSSNANLKDSDEVAPVQEDIDDEACASYKDFEIRVNNSEDPGCIAERDSNVESSVAQQTCNDSEQSVGNVKKRARAKNRELSRLADTIQYRYTAELFSGSSRRRILYRGDSSVDTIPSTQKSENIPKRQKKRRCLSNVVENNS